VDEMKTVSENAIIKAVKYLFYSMKIIVDLSGELGLVTMN
jgi:threonine dehydratase